jgi:hypothetical protein
MDKYIDSEGVECEAFQLEGPTILNTLNGEQCGEAGQWALYATEKLPVFVENDIFLASFTRS